MTEQEFYEQGMKLGYTKAELRKIVEFKESIETENLSIGGFEDVLPPELDRVIYTQKGVEEEE